MLQHAVEVVAVMQINKFLINTSVVKIGVKVKVNLFLCSFNETLHLEVK